MGRRQASRLRSSSFGGASMGRGDGSQETVDSWQATGVCQGSEDRRQVKVVSGH